MKQILCGLLTLWIAFWGFSPLLLAQETDSDFTGRSPVKRVAPSPFSDFKEEESDSPPVRSFKKKSQKRERSYRKQDRDRRLLNKVQKEESYKVKKRVQKKKAKKKSDLTACPPDKPDCPAASLKEPEAEEAEEEKEKAIEEEEAIGEEEEETEEEPLSPFEQYVRGQTDSSQLWDIRQFGHELFGQTPSTFAPTDLTPVSPDYPLGPGDEIVIALWGKVQLDFFAEIDPEGKINLPDMGVVSLLGLTFKEAKGMLEKELSRYYRPSEVKMNISMGRLRSIRVFVVGAAKQPGSYTLSSFSTLVNAVLASGGANKSGSLRDIHLRRNGKPLVSFDLYDFLLKGDKSRDVRLLPDDVIFIPAVGPLVGIVGPVKNPAIYEMKGTTRLLDLIEMAGGLAAIAFEERVQVQRIKDHQQLVFFEESLAEIKKDPTRNLTLFDGDIVRIFPIIQESNEVVVAGAVGIPGGFGVTSGVTRVKDVLEQAGGLLYYALEQGELTRIRVTQNGPQTEYIGLDFKKALAGDLTHNIPLERNDYILVKAVPEWRIYGKVRIRGEVRFPGEYTLSRGDTIRTLVERAGGFTERAYLKGTVFTRESVRLLQKKRLSETVDRLEQRVLSAGAGTIATALSPEAVLLQKGVLEQRQELLDKLRLVEPLGRVSLEFDSHGGLNGFSLDMSLEEGDTLFIPERPSSVQVMGSVYNPGSYIYAPRFSLSQYLKKSGGVDQYADEGEVYILKMDGTAVSRRSRSSFFIFNWITSPSLDPGDTIVVPEEIDKIAWLRDIKDVVHILYEVAIAAGVYLNFAK
jgi:protein involved in polysaccharide export with SLBB domain